jgi:hypothetical protein
MHGPLRVHPADPRPGPGAALDGKPRFDLTLFNQTYFDRVRSCVVAARDKGIYASVMLFNGFSIEGKGNVGGDPWQGHPFNPKNNVNGIDGGEWKPVGDAFTWTPEIRGLDSNSRSLEIRFPSPNFEFPRGGRMGRLAFLFSTRYHVGCWVFRLRPDRRKSASECHKDVTTGNPLDRRRTGHHCRVGQGARPKLTVPQVGSLRHRYRRAA